MTTTSPCAHRLDEKFTLFRARFREPICRVRRLGRPSQDIMREEIRFAVAFAIRKRAKVRKPNSIELRSPSTDVPPPIRHDARIQKKRHAELACDDLASTQRSGGTQNQSTSYRPAQRPLFREASSRCVFSLALAQSPRLLARGLCPNALHHSRERM